MSASQLKRVRRFCLSLPETSERLSHGEPTFFVNKKVFTMFANNHHGDGRVAVWLPAPEAAQQALIASQPETFFRPPYVGVRGWVGVELEKIRDADLELHIQVAWRLVAPTRLTRGAAVGVTVEAEVGVEAVVENATKVQMQDKAKGAGKRKRRSAPARTSRGKRG
mgnify:CR=1 FL=1